MKKIAKRKPILSSGEVKALLKYLGYPVSLYYSLKKSLGRKPDLEDLGKSLGFKVEIPKDLKK